MPPEYGLVLYASIIFVAIIVVTCETGLPGMNIVACNVDVTRR